MAIGHVLSLPLAQSQPIGPNKELLQQQEPAAPLMPNVMKVYLENGQTKSFKYDSATTVADVLNSLQQKLGFKSMDHFSLCVEHVKSIRKNKLTLLDPAESLAWVRPLSTATLHRRPVEDYFFFSIDRLPPGPEPTTSAAC